MMLLKKVVRVREFLIRTEKSRVPYSLIIHPLNVVKKWVEFYPKASDKGVRAFYSNHKTEIHALIPGAGSSSREKILSELTEFFG